MGTAIERDSLVQNRKTEFSHTFERSRDNLELIDHFISSNDDDYNITNIYKNFYIKIEIFSTSV